jgi:Uma2 family endonuclease
MNASEVRDGTPMTEGQFRALVLADPAGGWELDHGHARRRPPMTMEHNRLAEVIGHLLRLQLGVERFSVGVDMGHTRSTRGRYFTPDVMVIPMAVIARAFPTPGEWEMYAEPLPLVVEVWSPSTGAYDVAEKLPAYQARGDAEIWLVHPYERWLRAWRRQPDGSYAEAKYGPDAVVMPASLPGVSIDLAELFRLLRPWER